MGSNCKCQRVAPQAATPLWNPPGYSYAAMTAVTTTTTSTSMEGVPSVVEPAPDFPALPTPMDTLPAPSTTSLLIKAGAGRGHAIQAMQAATRTPGPTVPGPCQVWPQSAIQQQVTSVGHKATQATPYQQQVFPSLLPARMRSGTTSTTSKPSTAPSTTSTTEAATRGRARSSP